MYILGLFIILLALVGLEFFNFNVSLTTALTITGFVLATLSFIIPRKPKFKNRELIYEYELLPITENMYALKLSDGKIICKYINQDNETKVEAVDSYWKEINEFETGEKACIKYYERKPKFTFTSFPFMISREEIEINIPKGTIIS